MEALIFWQYFDCFPDIVVSDPLNLDTLEYWNGESLDDYWSFT